MKNKLLKSPLIFAVLIFLLFAILRFYNLDKRIIFDWDQEQYSYQVKNIIQNKDLTLLGPRVQSDKGFFLGPYFTYVLIPFYLVNRLHPSALLYFIILYNLLFFAVSFFVIKKMFGTVHALSFLSLWSIVYLVINYDTIPWNPILIPLGVVLTWMALFKRNYVILGLVLGFFVNMHFQFIFLIIFSVIFLILDKNRKEIIKLKNLLLFIFSFLILFIPLFLFDLRHDFLNTKLFFNFFASGDATPQRDLLSWLPVFINFAHPLIVIKNIYLMFLFYASILIIFIFLAIKKRNFFRTFYQVTAFIWIITLVFFSFYGKRPSEYYFVFLYPFIFIALTDFFLTIKKQYFLYLLFIFILATNFKANQYNLSENPRGLYYKDRAIKLLKNSIDLNKQFNISLNTPLGANNGYKYLIDWYEIRQSGNWQRDPLVEIRIPPGKNDLTINGAIGLKIPPEVKK